MIRCIAFLCFPLLIVLAITACGRGRSPAEGQAAPMSLRAGTAGIQFTSVHFLRESPGCAADETRCARLRVEYPTAVIGPASVRDFFNDTVESHVLRSLAVFSTTSDEPLPSLEMIAGRLLADYEKYAEDMGAYQTPWEVELVGEVMYQSPQFISIALEQYSYLGGAHPSTVRELLNFDLQHRRLLTLSHILYDPDQLKPLIEARFREYHQIDGQTDLNQAGFFWDQSLFLPANFAVTAEGLFLYYNSYEAAPYAVGPTELLIPWPALKGMVRPDLVF